MNLLEMLRKNHEATHYNQLISVQQHININLTHFLPVPDEKHTYLTYLLTCVSSSDSPHSAAINMSVVPSGCLPSFLKLSSNSVVCSSDRFRCSIALEVIFLFTPSPQSVRGLLSSASGPGLELRSDTGCANSWTRGGERKARCAEDAGMEERRRTSGSSAGV